MPEIATPRARRSSRAGDWLALIAWIALPLAAGWIGSQTTDPAWYRALDRPDWAPPSYLFGPVWSVLYLLMGVAAWLVWRRAGFAGAGAALGLFIVQIVFNGAWSWIFFGLRRADLAFAEIVILWALILATIVAFRRHHRLAAWLLAPYLAWVTYAAALNFALWRLGA